MNIEKMYLNGMSIIEIAKKTNIPKSTIRYKLKKLDCLRTHKEAQKLASKNGKLSHMKGKKRIFTDEWRKNMSISKLKYADKHAKGVSLKPNGYYEYTRGENKGRLVHVCLMEKEIGRRLFYNECVHHINHIKTDNRLCNLQLMKRSEHAKIHAIENHKKGLCYDISKESKQGQEHHNSKLKDKDVIEILTEMKSTKYYCNKFGVSQSVIQKIKRRESWKHIKIK